MSVYKTGGTPVLTKVVKEQQKTIDELKEQNKTISILTEKVNGLEKEFKLKGSVALTKSDLY